MQVAALDLRLHSLLNIDSNQEKQQLACIYIMRAVPKVMQSGDKDFLTGYFIQIACIEHEM